MYIVTASVKPPYSWWGLGWTGGMPSSKIWTLIFLGEKGETPGLKPEMIGNVL